MINVNVPRHHINNKHKRSKDFPSSHEACGLEECDVTSFVDVINSADDGKTVDDDAVMTLNVDVTLLVESRKGKQERRKGRWTDRC